MTPPDPAAPPRFPSLADAWRQLAPGLVPPGTPLAHRYPFQLAFFVGAQAMFSAMLWLGDEDYPGDEADRCAGLSRLSGELDAFADAHAAREG
jgi:hypothetical protein